MKQVKLSPFGMSVLGMVLRPIKQITQCTNHLLCTTKSKYITAGTAPLGGEAPLPLFPYFSGVTLPLSCCHLRPYIVSLKFPVDRLNETSNLFLHAEENPNYKNVFVYTHMNACNNDELQWNTKCTKCYKRVTDMLQIKASMPQYCI